MERVPPLDVELVPRRPSSAAQHALVSLGPVRSLLMFHVMIGLGIGGRRWGGCEQQRRKMHMFRSVGRSLQLVLATVVDGLGAVRGFQRHRVMLASKVARHCEDLASGIRRGVAPAPTPETAGRYLAEAGASGGASLVSRRQAEEDRPTPWPQQGLAFHIEMHSAAIESVGMRHRQHTADAMPRGIGALPASSASSGQRSPQSHFSGATGCTAPDYRLCRRSPEI